MKKYFSEGDCWGDVVNKEIDVGYLVLKQLDFLKYEPFGDRILDYVHSLRPSKINVYQSNDPVSCDFFLWRVHIYLTDEKKIDCIEQEVEVGLRTADNGFCLEHEIPKKKECGR